MSDNFNPQRRNKARYRGKFTPQYLVFNDNLQEFSYQVSIICSLETNGKLTPEEAYLKCQKRTPVAFDKKEIHYKSTGDEF